MQNFRYVTYISSIGLQESLLNYRTSNLKAREQYRHSSQCELSSMIQDYTSSGSAGKTPEIEVESSRWLRQCATT